MAILSGKRYGEAVFALQVEPITPTINGPEDEYYVAILENGKVLFDRRYQVWQYKHRFSLGHYWMFRIARAFQFASKLITSKTDFTLSPLLDASPENNQPICIREGIDWLEVVLWGNVVKNERRFFVMVFVDSNTTLSESQAEPQAKNSFRLNQFANITFYCSPDDAEMFGRTLEAECEAARRRRKELGISAWDDVDDDESGVTDNDSDNDSIVLA